MGTYYFFLLSVAVFLFFSHDFHKMQIISLLYFRLFHKDRYVVNLSNGMDGYEDEVDEKKNDVEI